MNSEYFNTNLMGAAECGKSYEEKIVQEMEFTGVQFA